jgi:hypothetical protein
LSRHQLSAYRLSRRRIARSKEGLIAENEKLQLHKKALEQKMVFLRQDAAKRGVVSNPDQFRLAPPPDRERRLGVHALLLKFF